MWSMVPCCKAEFKGAHLEVAYLYLAFSLEMDLRRGKQTASSSDFTFRPGPPDTCDSS